MSRTAAIYCRVDNGGDPSSRRMALDMQKEGLERYADFAGFEIAGAYEDNGYHGRDLNRPGLNQMIQDCKAGRFEYVLVMSRGRLFRGGLVDEPEWPFQVCTPDPRTEDRVGTMELRDLTTPFEKRRVIMYAPDGNTVVYHWREMQKIEGNIYRGPSLAPELGTMDSCELYCYFSDRNIGLSIGSCYTSKLVADLMEWAEDEGVLSSEAFIDRVKAKVQGTQHIMLTWVEMLKYIEPDLIPACMESRLAHSKRLEAAYRERKRKQAEQEKEFVDGENKAAKELFLKTVSGVAAGEGTVRNDTITVYRSRYNSASYSAINLLARLYGVSIPIKVQGWINSSLSRVDLEQSACCNYWYQRSKHGKGSKTFFGYMNSLVKAVQESVLSPEDVWAGYVGKAAAEVE